MADMPFLSFHLSPEETIRNAGGFLQRGADAVKLEGGAKRVEMVRALVDCEIPVMGHLGLTPQSVNIMGGFKVQGRKADDALRLLDDAHRLQEAGCFALVLEGIPAELAQRATESLSIPTIGIGAGPGCSGQVLVFHDVLGLTEGRRAKFVRAYADGFQLLQERRCRAGLPMSAVERSRRRKSPIGFLKAWVTSSQTGLLLRQPDVRCYDADDYDGR
ncbi:3-methyl-2-oxobutanoate hydroxymethyltransferase [Bradyrhizobium sp. GM7.3]